MYLAFHKSMCIGVLPFKLLRGIGIVNWLLMPPWIAVNHKCLSSSLHLGPVMLLGQRCCMGMGGESGAQVSHSSFLAVAGHIIAAELRAGPPQRAGTSTCCWAAVKHALVPSNTLSFVSQPEHAQVFQPGFLALLQLSGLCIKALSYGFALMFPHHFSSLRSHKSPRPFFQEDS